MADSAAAPLSESEIAELNRRFDTATPEEILTWAVETFPTDLVMTSSFQHEGVALAHMLRPIRADVPVIFINTRFHFRETLEYCDTVVKLLGLNLRVVESAISFEDFKARYTAHLYNRDPDLCCRINKVASGRTPHRLDGPATASGLALTMLDTVVIPTEMGPPEGRREAWFGSLSGLARDPRSGRYLAVVDDRLPSRLAWIDITADAGRLSVMPVDVVPLRPSNGVDARLVVGADLESLVALPDGTWVASEEGHYSTGAPGQPAAGEWPPALHAIDTELRVTRIQPWPERFALGAGRGGVRDNQGFEALTRTPDGRLIAGLEQPLQADLAAPLRNGRPFSTPGGNKLLPFSRNAFFAPASTKSAPLGWWKRQSSVGGP